MNDGLNDPARAYKNKPGSATLELASARVRFAPAENLYDAIRRDVGSHGIDGFEPLIRHYDREPRKLR